MVRMRRGVGISVSWVGVEPVAAVWRIRGGCHRFQTIPNNNLGGLGCQKVFRAADLPSTLMEMAEMMAWCVKVC